MGAIIFAVVVAAIALGIFLQSALHRRRIARARIRVDLAIRERLELAPGPVDVREVLAEAVARSDVGSGDLFEQILDRVDLSRFRPKLADDIEIKRFPLRWGNDYAMVANPRAMLYYRLEPWEADMLPLMDGTRTAGEIAVARLEEEGELDASGATELIQILEVGGFLEPVPVGSPGRSRSSPRSPDDRPTEGPHVPQDALDRMDRRRPIRPLVVPADPSPVLPARGDGDRRGDRRGGARDVPRDRALRTLHVGLEVGSDRVPHPARPGLRADVLPRTRPRQHDHPLRSADKSAGFMIYFGSPSFFVEASDSLMLERRQRITESFSGPFAELILAGASTLVLALFPDAAFSALLYKFALDQLLRDLLEPDTAPGARRLLDLDRPDPGAEPSPAFLGVLPTRPVAQASDPHPVEQAGDRPWALRRPRDPLHDLLVLYGVLLLEAGLRRFGVIAVERWLRLQDPARAARRVPGGTRDPGS